MGLERGNAASKNDDNKHDMSGGYDGVEMLSLLHCDDDDVATNDGSVKEVKTARLSTDSNRSLRLVIVAICGTLGCLLLLILLSIRHDFVAKAFHHQPTIIGNKTTLSCDCFNPAPRCCDRTIFRTHKFGTILIGDMFLPNRQKNTKFRIHTMPTPKNLDYALPTTLDYRHVLVTRNWLDAIVSGYLYHKAGYECTMDYKGNATGLIQHHTKYFDLERHYHLKDWDTDLQVVTNLIPPRHNRSFCQYLAEESEEVGVKMVMDFALARWYKGVVPYYHKAQEAMRQQQQQQSQQPKSMLLCFEDLVDPFQQEDLFHSIASFLFPGLNETQEWQLPGQLQASIERQKASHGSYEGGHASNHDPTVRDRLKKLVEVYDREIFDNVVASSNALFHCG